MARSFKSVVAYALLIPALSRAQGDATYPTLCETMKASGSQQVQFDPNKTKVTFGWDGLFNTISFSFQLKSGAVRLDPAAGVASGEVVLDAKDIKGGNVFRNRHLRDQVLESSRYPDVRFRPDSISKIVSLNRCACRFDLKGTLELRGKQNPFGFQVDVGAVGDILDLTARSGIVNWSTFGATDYGTGLAKIEDSSVYVRSGVHVNGVRMPPDCNNSTGIAGERKPY